MDERKKYEKLFEKIREAKTEFEKIAGYDQTSSDSEKKPSIEIKIGAGLPIGTYYEEEFDEGRTGAMECLLDCMQPFQGRGSFATYMKAKSQDGTEDLSCSTLASIDAKQGTHSIQRETLSGREDKQEEMRSLTTEVIKTALEDMIKAYKGSLQE